MKRLYGIMLTAAQTVMCFPVHAEYNALPVIVWSVPFGDRHPNVTIQPKFALELETASVLVNVRADVDMVEVQRALVPLVEGPKTAEDCGDTVDIDSVTASAKGPKLQIDGSLHVDLPRCKVKDGVRIPSSFASRQIIHFCIEAVPQVESGVVSLVANTVCASPSGAFGAIVSTLHMREYVITQFDKVLQKELSHHKLKYIFPPDFERYDVKITNVSFFDQGGGKLGMKIDGSGRLTRANTVELIERFLAPAKASSP